MLHFEFDFPPAPPGFHRIGWHGIALILPEAWNLRLHDGDGPAGALVFADLRANRLEVRWKSPRRFRWRRPGPRQLLEQTLERLRKRHATAAVARLADDAARIETSDGTLLLTTDDRRLYELHWPGAAPGSPKHFVNPITEDFLRIIPLLARREERFWAVYGAAGWTAPGMRLKKASLLPGATKLEFTGRGQTATLGAFSLADRLLKNGISLRAWATEAIPTIARHPAGTWQEAPGTATFTAPARRRFRRMHHVVNLQHDAAQNLIRWNHHFGPAVG